MSLFDEASLVITPNGTKASKLYAIKPTDGSGDLTVTRATSATRVNSAGLIETVASNVPRIDYSGGGCPSILVEPQRTNLVLNSATVTTQTIASLAQVYTLSFYGSGTITLSGTHTATVVGLGTERKTYTFTAILGALVLTVSGTCTNGQLEAGSYATSYIPTTSAAVTRNADVISKTGISDLIGQTEGTFFVEISALSNDRTNRLISLTNGTSSERISIFYSEDLSNEIKGIIFVGGAIQCNFSYTGADITNNTKIAIKYKSNNFALWVNGVERATDNSGVTFSANTLDKLSFDLGTSSTVLPFNGKVKSIILFKNALTNAELAELTTL